MSESARARRAAEVAEAVRAQKERLERACHAAGRSPADVALLPVTKYFPASDAHILYTLGLRDFGESRVQEAAAKVAAFRGLEPNAAVRWHMIGQLQRNKANVVARWAAAVHSVDNSKLIAALARGVATARDRGERATDADLAVYLQVSLDGDTQRGGAAEPELDALGAAVAEADGLALAGLMAVPPLGADPERSFARLHEIHVEFLRSFPGATQLSAGMSGDMEVAVRHGSTCVRVGTALLGLRTITSP